MARQVLPIVGAVVGGIYGGPQGAQIGFAIGSVVGNAVDPQRLAGPKIGEVAVQTAEEGAVCPLYVGTCAASGNLIYKHLFDPVIVEEQQGKGGGPVIESERLYGTFAVRIGASLFDGPGVRNGITGLVRIWEDEKLVYDVSPTSVILEESAEYANGFTFYAGTETQLPDPDIEAIEGVGNVPAYRGRAYIVFNYKDLTDRKGSVPQFRFECSVTSSEVEAATLITDSVVYGGPASNLSQIIANTWAGTPVDRSISVSPGGEYIVAGLASSPYMELRQWNQETGTYDQIALPASPPTVSVGSTSWSGNGEYLSVGQFSASSFKVYRVQNGVFTALANPSTLVAPIALAMDSQGQRLAVAVANAVSSIYLYPIVGDTIGEPSSADSLINLFGATSIAFSDDDLFVASGGNQGLEVFRTASANEITHFDGISTTPDCGRGVCFSANNGYIYTLSTSASSGNWLAVYSFNEAAVAASDALQFDNYPSSQPSGGRDLSINSAGDFLAVAEADTQIKMYAAAESILTLTATQPPVALGNISQANFVFNDSAGIIEPGTSTLPDVVEAIARRVKQPSSLFNTAQVASYVVRGAIFGSQDYNATDAMRSLAQTFLFDVSDYDEQLHLIPRGGAVEFSVTEDDLAEAPGDFFVRANAIEQPGKISLFFQNPTIYYQPSKVNPPFIGYENGAVNEVTIQVPVVLNEADEAPQLVDKMQKINEVDAQGEITRVVSDRYLSVVPGAVGALTERGITRRVRVTGVEEYDYRMKLKMRVDRQSAVTSNLTVTPTPAPDPPPPSLAGVTQFVVMNIPGITDGDDALGVGIRVGVRGLPGTAWSGCRVDYSTDSGANWTVLASLTRQARIGTLLADVADASPHYSDLTNTVSVLMVGNESLESLTQNQLLSEGNGAALVNSDATAEIIQFRDVVDEGDQEWTLSRLLRGRLSSAVTSHLAGKKFVMLEDTSFLPLPTALIGSSIRLRFTSNGTSPETAPTFDFTWNPVYSQREFTPAHLFLERSGDIISCSAVPRHRFGTDDSPIASRDWTGYRWTATDGSNNATQDTAGVTPSASFDVTGWASPVTVTVAMVNRFTGVGPTISEAIA